MADTVNSRAVELEKGRTVEERLRDHMNRLLNIEDKGNLTADRIKALFGFKE